MLDRFYFVGDAAKLVVCAEGHVQRGDLQTKELECRMQSYYVHGPIEPDMSFQAFEFDRFADPTYRMNGDALVRESRGRRAWLSGTVGVHTHCVQCLPVYYEAEKLGWLGDVANMSPRCQWLLVLDEGRLTKVLDGGCESREATRRKLRENGLVPIPDDNRQVRREIELWQESRTNGITPG